MLESTSYIQDEIYRRYKRKSQLNRRVCLTASAKHQVLRIEYPESSIKHPVSSIKLNQLNKLNQPINLLLRSAVKFLDLDSVRGPILKQGNLGNKFNIPGLFKAGNAGTHKFNQLPGLKTLIGF